MVSTRTGPLSYLVVQPLSVNKVSIPPNDITLAYRFSSFDTAIQLAKLSGFSPIITTASLHNQDLLLSLGATHILDRKLSKAALIQRVRKLVTIPLSYIFDAVSVKETQQAAYALLAPGGTLVVVSPLQVGGDDDASGKKVLFVIGSFHPPPNRALGAKFASALTRWLEEGKIKVRALSLRVTWLTKEGMDL